MSSYRELELLVSRIEGALAPAGAVIRSPDRIPDLITNELREVDVSIRRRVGSVDLLVPWSNLKNIWTSAEEVRKSFCQ
ncbi:MAG: hypothetical protein ABR568_03875 [Pyrinomonadaceae bacterium]